MRKGIAVLIFILLVASGWITWRRLESQQAQERLGEIQSILEGEAEEIGRFESDVLAQAGLLSEIEANLGGLNQGIQEFEAAYPDGIPEELFAGYEDQVTRYNRMVTTYNEAVARYDLIFEAYSGRVTRYNLLVNEANQLAFQVGVPWTIGQWASEFRK